MITNENYTNKSILLVCSSQGENVGLHCFSDKKGILPDEIGGLKGFGNRKNE